jgi:hypothetical protein
MNKKKKKFKVTGTVWTRTTYEEIIEAESMEEAENEFLNDPTYGDELYSEIDEVEVDSCYEVDDE